MKEGTKRALLSILLIILILILIKILIKALISIIPAGWVTIKAILVLIFKTAFWFIIIFLLVILLGLIIKELKNK